MLNVMFIDQLILFLEEASQLPIELWWHNFLMTKPAFKDELISAGLGIEESDPMAEKLNSFLTLLDNDDPDERELAEGFKNLGEIFKASGIVNDKIKLYQDLSFKFLKRVEKELQYLERNEQYKKETSEEEQKAFDERLFQNEGLNYCLLYYLTYYKTLFDLKTIEEKSAFILKKEVNLGFGGLPGIRLDFAADESLDKFILLILDDETRKYLLREYYLCKQVILRARTVEEVEYSLYEFIYALLSVFEKHGVKNASNGFFAPYGKSVPVQQVLSLFESDYVPGI